MFKDFKVIDYCYVIIDDDFEEQVGPGLSLFQAVIKVYKNRDLNVAANIAKCINVSLKLININLIDNYEHLDIYREEIKKYLLLT